MTLPQAHLARVLALIREHLPGIRRVSSYCLPRNLRSKTVRSPPCPLLPLSLAARECPSA